MTETPIWWQDWSVLLNSNHIFEVYPTSQMDSNAKLNATTRAIMSLSLVAWVLFQNVHFLVIGVLGLLVVYAVWCVKKQGVRTKEAFAPIQIDTAAELKSILKSDYRVPNRKNPFGNRLPLDDVQLPSAPPAFNGETAEKITKEFKRSVQMMNPGIQTSKELFGDIRDRFEQEQSQRQFYSVADTSGTQGGDTIALANACYGSMRSCRGLEAGDSAQCFSDNTRYPYI